MSAAFARMTLAALALAAAGCSAGEKAPDKPAGSSVRHAPQGPVEDNLLPEDATPSTSFRFLTALTNPHQSGRWAPRDDCAGEPGALEFREALAEAVLARDADALAALALPDIQLDFGGGAGIKELRRRLAEKDQSLWKALRNLIPLGCALNGQGGLTMPWYFAQDIPAGDPYLQMIVRGVGVPLRAEPKPDGKILSRLSWDSVELVSDPGVYAEVTTPQGAHGYVEAARLRAMIDYRLIADRSGQGYRIAALVAGD